MSQTNISSDDGNIELGASLLITGSKYNKKWRKSLYVGIMISLKKPTTFSSNFEESASSPLLYNPLPHSPPARTSSAKSFVSIDVVSHVQDDVVEERVRTDIARIVKEKDLKSLRELGGVGRVCDVLHSQTQHSSEEITENLGVQATFYGILWKSCKQNLYTISMLLISALLSFATEFKQVGPRYGWHDGVAMIFAVLLLLAFSSITSYWRERKTIKLAKKKGKAVKFSVKRHQESQSVDLTLSMYDIMVGDEVYLSPPDEVPANGLLLGKDNLVLVEGIKNEKIDCEATNPFLIASSKVVEGRGWMLVTSVQNKSNSSEIKRRLLENLIEKPISYLDKASLFIFTLVALVLFIRLICKKDGDDGGLPDIKGNVSVGMLTKLLENILSGPRGRIAILAHILSVIVLCVQHGVPLMITLSLRYQNDEVLINQEVVLNDLSACTTMGLVNVICIDVSGGGLICKPMEVCEIWIGEGETDINNIQESGTSQVVLEKLKEGVCLSVLAPGLSRSHVSNSLVSWANSTLEMDIISFREDFHILKHGKLDSNQEGNGVLVRKVSANEQDMHLHWSGDASIVLEICSQYYDGEGTCHSIENQKIKFEQVIQKMERSGLKPIAFAYRQTQVQELKQDEMTLLALIGLKYKCQVSTKLALKNLQNNGMRIKLVSEDDDIMVLNDMACELGMEVSIDGGHLEGKQLRDLDEKARLVKVDKAIAMGSFSPIDKLLMVKCLQDRGDVVAFVEQRLMTNHISDVLKLADVGIINHSLSKIIDRKENSDISIMCFSVLETIVKVGRSKYRNIQKFIQLQLTIGISGLLITLITTILTGNSPLTAIQLIWVNALMCPLGGLMMVTELSSEEELAKLPSHRNQSIITKKMWKNIIFQILYQASAIMILEFGGHVSDSEKQLRKVMIFNTFFLCQLFHLLNIMDLLKTEVFKVDVQKYCFLVALGCCFVLQTVIVEYAKSLADCMRLNATEWAICVLVSSVSWVLKWTLKKILSGFFNTNYTSPLDSPQSTPQPLFYLYWGLPAMMLLLFPIGLVSMKLH
ncbi:putative calcium-transporting ATPase 13, plasma membrane-type [Vicia villosa]|uniref:putative calcium-transporting ATPase 13, plasma membrane-type n=1 Tax=Vicia villosa TaxID=3911 RepID=UPI00273C6C17|nr:putative calcium-transporting ATPase 13, plasma membrane-type [Vicia villosa]